MTEIYPDVIANFNTLEDIAQPDDNVALYLKSILIRMRAENFMRTLAVG